jgi:signal transduction histidine kinase
MTQVPPPILRERTRHEAVSTVYSRLPGTSIVNVINAGLIVLVLADRGHARGALEWLTLMALLSCARGLLYLRYRADRDKAGRARRWERVAVLGSFCAGLLWGLGPVLPFSHFSTHLWFWAFVIAGMSAGATSLHAAHLPTALAFVVPATLPLAVSLLLQDTLQGYAAAGMTIAFVAVMSFTGMLFSREFARMQALKFTVEQRAVELDESNRRLSREIHDHRSTSEALHQSQKMEALGNLTGGFAHDFNNILTVIISNLDSIAAQTRQARIKELALSATNAAESGADLLSRLLAFARKQPLEPRLVNVVDVVADFRDLLMHAVSGPVRVAFDFSVPVAVASIDPAQFQAMLLNLVVNARDAMPPQGGLITVRVSKIELGEEALRGTEARPGWFVAVRVEDDGEGMAPETLAHAFEPFFTTKADRGGTGLGLSQVYGFARQSGGFGSIESTPGEGSCVTIAIPALDDRLAPQGVQSGRAVLPAGACSMLLVDDNAAVLRTLAAGLAEDGWDVASAETPQEALAMAAERRFDIVVTDVEMPGEMNGLKLATALRALYPDLPVLLMSGAPVAMDMAGPDFPFITKPFRKHAFIEKVQSLVAQG